MSEDLPFLERIRALCLSFPGTIERESHGALSFFIDGKRSFLQYRNNHHGDGRIAVWAAAAPGIQSELADSDPRIYFVPPYVGHLGWIGMRLDRGAAWEQIEVVVGDAYLAKAPRKYLALLHSR